MGTLFFIGDSITTGAWDERGGWTNRLIGKIMDHTIQADFKENGRFPKESNKRLFFMINK